MSSDDVAIVGAGPAGARAAYVLARHGARVTIFDASHPREKPCGGGVTGRALALAAGAIDTRALPRCEIRAARFVDSTRDLSASVTLGSGDLVVASRTDFDSALFAAAEAAGATPIRSRVRDIVSDGDGFTVTTRDGSVRARTIVGADGANSLVRRRFAQPFDRADISIATGYFVHRAAGDEDHEIIIELTADPPGYIWSFPRPTHLAVGICAQADAGIGVDALRARALDWIARRGWIAARSSHAPGQSRRSRRAVLRR
jgi:flavin-dependent dehydrogenase